MSATPRKWHAGLINAIADERFRLQKLDIHLDVADVMRSMDPWLNAFDALLAVAKGTDHHNCECTDASPCNASSTCLLYDAIEALDAAHPDWRTWT